MNFSGGHGIERLKQESPLMKYLTRRMQKEDSRNELIRIALHGLLRRGLYSTSSLNTTGGISSTSTLRDADDIRQDSLNDYSQSEGEVVFPRDPVPVRRYDPGTVTSDASPRLRSNASPGELSPTVLRSNRKSSPGEIKTRSGGRRARSASPTGRRVITVAPSSPPGQRRQQTPNASRENSDSRSLHKSDLQHKHWEQPLNTSREGSPQRSPRDERQPSRGSDRQQSPPNHPNRGSDRQQSPPSHPNRGSDRQQSPPNQPSRGRDRQQSPPNQPSRSSDRQQTPPRSAGQRPVSRPPIHVPMPSMDQDDSSGYSRGERPGYDLGDTSGDVSPISGGDF